MTWAIRVGKIGLLVGSLGTLAYLGTWTLFVIGGVIAGVLFLIGMATAISELVADL